MYTFLNDPVIEESLRKQLDVIVKHTLDLYGTDCTIILAGGFGRGEGSIRMNQNKVAIPLHDFDTYVITKRTANSAKHEAMEQNIIQELSNLTGTDLRKEGFVLGVEVVPRGSLGRLPPDLSTFEMKASSTILYGPDVRKEIPVRSEDIALASGAITLFHRTTALLKNVEPEFLASQEYPPARRLETVYECCKVYTEICTALSLLGGFYEPSYQARAEEFGKHYSSFPELQRKLIDLPEKVSFHTRMKLVSDFSPIINKTVETWTETRKALDAVLRFFLSKFLGVDAEGSWVEFFNKSRGRMRWFFFQDYLSFYLARLGLYSSPLVRATNLAFQAYDYQSFQRKARKQGKYALTRPFSFTSPIFDVYFASALVLFALEDDGAIDQGMMNAGRNYIGRVLYSRNVGSVTLEHWKNSRDLCVEGQRLYFGAKQQKTVL